MLNILYDCKGMEELIVWHNFIGLISVYHIKGNQSSSSIKGSYHVVRFPNVDHRCKHACLRLLCVNMGRDLHDFFPSLRIYISNFLKIELSLYRYLQNDADVWLTLSPVAGMVFAPKHIFGLIIDFLTFPKYQNKRF